MPSECNLRGALKAYLESLDAEDANVRAANAGKDFENPDVLAMETRGAEQYCLHEARKALELDPRDRMARAILVMFGPETDNSESCGLYPEE